MNKINLGLNDYIIFQIEKLDLDMSSIARVVKEHKERYIISTFENEYEAEITGNLRFSAKSREDFPAVGDWVEFIPFEENNAIIQSIIPRKTLLERKSVSSSSEKQIIASNIDIAFIVQSVDRDFNINRLERYVSLIHSGLIVPVVILNKTDLISDDDLHNKIDTITNQFTDIKIISTSNVSLQGIENLKQFLETDKTYCFVGSSGVGKSSIINSLQEKDSIKINEISTATNKGKHTTTHRELITLNNGSILIDTPGMREIGLTDALDGIKKTFTDIEDLSKNCKFNNCTHTNEKGCAILEALYSNIIDQNTYDNFQKLIRESQHFQASVSEKRKKDKEFGKMIKNVKEIRKKNKF
jgi:ribosome biogenesis GTPase